MKYKDPNKKRKKRKKKREPKILVQITKIAMDKVRSEYELYPKRDKDGKWIYMKDLTSHLIEMGLIHPRYLENRKKLIAARRKTV